MLLVQKSIPGWTVVVLDSIYTNYHIGSDMDWFSPHLIGRNVSHGNMAQPTLSLLQQIIQYPTFNWSCLGQS